MSDAGEEMAAPQLYLILTEPDGDALARLLEAAPVACVRYEAPASSEDDILRAADVLRPLCHDADIAFLISEHYRLVRPTGADGVHLMGSRDVREARKVLGQDAVVGAFVGTSRHAGMTAGEIGANYIAFGPVSDTGLGRGDTAPDDLFAWWSQAIELPVVAEGGLTEAKLAALKPHTDFFALGPEITRAEDPAAALKRVHTLITGDSVSNLTS